MNVLLVLSKINKQNGKHEDLLCLEDTKIDVLSFSRSRYGGDIVKDDKKEKTKD